jgi:hypothetical protein
MISALDAAEVSAALPPASAPVPPPASDCPPSAEPGRAGFVVSPLESSPHASGATRRKTIAALATNPVIDLATPRLRRILLSDIACTQTRTVNSAVTRWLTYYHLSKLRLDPCFLTALTKVPVIQHASHSWGWTEPILADIAVAKSPLCCTGLITTCLSLTGMDVYPKQLLT